MVVMTGLPFLATLVISTLNWNALDPGRRSFVGLDNYKTVFTDPAMRQAVVNTIVFTPGHGDSREGRARRTCKSSRPARRDAR